MPRARIREMAGMFKGPMSIGIWIGIAGGVIGGVAAVVGVTVAAAVSGLPAFVVVIVAGVTLLFCVGFFAVFYIVFSAVLGPAVGRDKLVQAVESAGAAPGPGGDNGKQPQNAEPADATVLSVSDTGVTLNDIYPYVQMELEVRPQGRPAYRMSSKFLINRLDIPRYQPGSVIGVVVDKNDPNNVALAGAPGAAQQAGMGRAEAEEMLKKVDAANQALLARGVAAKATVIKAWEMGITVNGPNPAMKFLLQVTPDGQPAFQSEATAVVVQASVPKYQPGNIISVKYDAADTTRVAIDHS